MRVLFYGKGLVNDVLEAVETVVSKDNIEVCEDLQCLSARLREPAEEVLVVLLVPPNRDDLKEILSMQPLLQNALTIVVAPDQETETVAMAHMLRPRFLTYGGEDPRTLTSVLYKMMANENSDGVKDRRSFPRE